MNIDQFVVREDVERSTHPPGPDLLEQAEQATGVAFGKALREYLLAYGYLARGAVEFYGLNSHQGLESDLVKQTLHLHRLYPGTTSYIALENQGDGDYYMVDSHDAVFRFIPERDARPIEIGQSLFPYILDRLRITAADR